MQRRPPQRPNLLARALVGAALVLCQAAQVCSQTGRRLVEYADPFVGTENGGNIVPGAQVPFGFVHASPDTERPTTAGYNPYENIRGFSQTHVSGTGGASKYGNFLTVPHVGKLRTNNLGSPKAEESASPGYYTVRLTRPDVRAELTATRLVAFHRYTFPASKLSHLVVEASSVVQPERGENAFFDNPPTRAEGFNPGLYNHNNEPNFLAPFLYTHAGRPDRTQERVRRILDTEYRTGRGGLPGNDDSGAMSSWYVWGATGLYPNAGQPFYYIASPLFERSTIDLGNGRAFVVEAQGTSATNIYIQTATFNGRTLSRAWLRHEEVAAGGRLVLRMGPQPTAWGREERPPSMSLMEKAR